MNPQLMRSLGFGKEVDLMENHQCPMCETSVNQADFKDELSRKEYEVSGLCASCQDAIFDADNDIGEDWDAPPKVVDWDSVDQIY
jgi:hypothetical protein